MAFKDIPGNGRIKTILKIALQRRRVPNSLLFSGPEGVGKKSMALNLAKALNCARLNDDVCDECESCRAIQAERFPDVMMIRPERDVIKIESMRFLKQIAYMKPLSGEKRVFIIEQAEKMNEEAANSLLKVLEEPPLFTHILLVTDNLFLILPTIKSRCQQLNFSSIAKEEIERILIEKKYSPDQAKILSILVNGNLEEALNLDWENVRQWRQEAWQMFLSLREGKGSPDFLSRYVFRQRFLAEEDFKRTLGMFASFLRDIILIKEKGRNDQLLNPDYEKAMRETEQAFSVEWSLDCLASIENVLAGLNKNLNMNLLAGAYYSNFGEESHV